LEVGKRVTEGLSDSVRFVESGNDEGKSGQHYSGSCRGALARAQLSGCPSALLLMLLIMILILGAARPSDRDHEQDHDHEQESNDRYL
jgi:hypothetical protein